MSLRSSELTSSIGRLRALDAQAAGGVLLLGPQQVVRLLADLRAAGPGAGAGDGVADAHRRRPAPGRSPGRRGRPARRRGRRTTVRRGKPEGGVRRGFIGVSLVSWGCAGSRGRLQPHCRQPPAARLPAHALALAVLCTRVRAFPEARVLLLRANRGSDRLRTPGALPARNARDPRHHRQRDEHRRGGRVGARRLLGRLDQPPVLRPAESDLYGDTDFDGRMSTLRAGDIVLTRLEANRHRVMRSSSLARSTEIGYLKIVAPYVGCAGVGQKGREAWVTPDQWSIYDTTDSYAVANPVTVEHLIVMVPKERLVERGLALDAADGAPPRRQRRRRPAGARDHALGLPRAARHVGGRRRAASATRSRSCVHLSMLDLAGIGTAHDAARGAARADQAARRRAPRRRRGSRSTASPGR